MSVYVDSMRANFGRMKMCHMLADTSEELVAMADRIGVQRKWIQNQGTHREHFDIALSKRALAVAAGAKEITMRELAQLLNTKRAALTVTSRCESGTDTTGDPACRSTATTPTSSPPSNASSSSC